METPDVIVQDTVPEPVSEPVPETVPEPVSEPVPEPVVDSGPTYIVSMDELVSLHSAVVAKEAADASALRSVFQPDPASLKARLVDWAAAGFPPTFTLFSAQIFPPSACSDNARRDLMPYIEFLLGSGAEDQVKILEEQVLGINLSFNVVQLNVVCLTVIRP